MTSLLVVSGKKDLLPFLDHLIDFSFQAMDPEANAEWPPLQDDAIIVMDQSAFERLDEENRRRARSRNIILLVDASLPLEISTAYHTARITLFYCSAHDGFNVQNLICLIRTVAEKAVLALRLDSYITDSFREIIDSTLLQKQKEEIETLNQKLHEISRVDPLTSLLNRRALMEAFDQEKLRALRHRWRLTHSGKNPGDRPEPPIRTDSRYAHRTKGDISEHIGNFACLIIDIDHFKTVNDSYGHLTGDETLRHLGVMLNRPGLFRESDIKGRYGGEEFIVLLPETNAENSLIPTRRFLNEFRAEIFTTDDRRTFSLTVSIGVSEFLPDELSSDEMIKRADQALYYAKNHGRNRICVYDGIRDIIIDAVSSP